MRSTLPSVEGWCPRCEWLGRMGSPNCPRCLASLVELGPVPPPSASPVDSAEEVFTRGRIVRRRAPVPLVVAVVAIATIAAAVSGLAGDHRDATLAGHPPPYPGMGPNGPEPGVRFGWAPN